MGQHGTRVGDVTMDSGEGWQWGVKTGRGPMRRNEKRAKRETNSRYQARHKGVGRSGVRWTSDKGPRGGAERDSSRGVPPYIEVLSWFGLGLFWPTNRGLLELAWVVQRLAGEAPNSGFLRSGNELDLRTTILLLLLMVLL